MSSSMSSAALPLRWSWAYSLRIWFWLNQPFFQVLDDATASVTLSWKLLVHARGSASSLWACH
eukprot:3558768-Amphidinium_carterae.1